MMSKPSKMLLYARCMASGGGDLIREDGSKVLAG